MGNAKNYIPSLAYGHKVYPENLVGGGGGTKGDYWFVDGDKGAGQGGRTWEDAFGTFAEAVSALSDDDVIYVGPAEYAEYGTTHVITESNVKIIGTSGRGIATEPTLRNWVDADDAGSEATMRLEGDNIEVANLRFLSAGGYWAIETGASTDPANLWVHDCYFYAAAIGSCNGVQAGRRDGSAGNAVSMLVEDNVFYKLGTALNLDASRGQVKRNTFVMTHTRTGITCPQSGSQRNSNEIVDNRFVAYGTPCTAYGINFTGASSPTVGSMWVDGNVFINMASAGTAVNKLSGYGGRNWYNDQFLTDANPPVATNWYA